MLQFLVCLFVCKFKSFFGRINDLYYSVGVGLFWLLDCAHFHCFGRLFLFRNYLISRSLSVAIVWSFIILYHSFICLRLFPIVFFWNVVDFSYRDSLSHWVLCVFAFSIPVCIVIAALSYLVRSSNFRQNAV